MKLNRRILGLVAVLGISAFAIANPRYSFSGTMHSSAPAPDGDSFSVSADGDIWDDYPSTAPANLHAWVILDGVKIWDNGSPGIPNFFPTGLVFNYDGMSFPVTSGPHTVTWVGTPTPILVGTTNASSYMWSYTTSFTAP